MAQAQPNQPSPTNVARLLSDLSAPATQLVANRVTGFSVGKSWCPCLRWVQWDRQSPLNPLFVFVESIRHVYVILYFYDLYIDIHTPWQICLCCPILSPTSSRTNRITVYDPPMATIARYISDRLTSINQP